MGLPKGQLYASMKSFELDKAPMTLKEEWVYIKSAFLKLWGASTRRHDNPSWGRNPIKNSFQQAVERGTAMRVRQISVSLKIAGPLEQMYCCIKVCQKSHKLRSGLADSNAVAWRKRVASVLETARNVVEKVENLIIKDRCLTVRETT
ncbi:hypothetical protein TNCV_3553491 [Trichonephila clavipes]|nr:hypothetical protein TNCV_3553491 [Trichonephila clavipes]